MASLFRWEGASVAIVFSRRVRRRAWTSRTADVALARLDVRKLALMLRQCDALARETESVASPLSGGSAPAARCFFIRRDDARALTPYKGMGIAITSERLSVCGIASMVFQG
jgi:hypothetical protein